MPDTRLGAFGWGTHQPRGGETRETKRRPCIVVMLNGIHRIVVFGRTERSLDKRQEMIDHRTSLGQKWGLDGPTYFEATPTLMPQDFDERGFFALLPGDAGHVDAIVDDTVWNRLRSLGDR